MRIITFQINWNLSRTANIFGPNKTLFYRPNQLHVLANNAGHYQADKNYKKERLQLYCWLGISNITKYFVW